MEGRLPVVARASSIKVGGVSSMTVGGANAEAHGARERFSSIVMERFDANVMQVMKIAMDLARTGSAGVPDWLRDRPQFQYAIPLDLLLGMFRIVLILDDLGIAHGDLRCEQFLVRGNQVVIGDFGFAGQYRPAKAFVLPATKYGPTPHIFVPYLGWPVGPREQCGMPHGTPAGAGALNRPLGLHPGNVGIVHAAMTEEQALDLAREVGRRVDTPRQSPADADPWAPVGATREVNLLPWLNLWQLDADLAALHVVVVSFENGRETFFEYGAADVDLLPSMIMEAFARFCPGYLRALHSRLAEGHHGHNHFIRIRKEDVLRHPFPNTP